MWLCPARYTALQTNNSARNFTAINPGHFRKLQEKGMIKPYNAIVNRYLALLAKRTETQKGKSMTHVLYVLQLAKRHASGLSNVKHPFPLLSYAGLKASVRKVSISRKFS